MGLAEFVASLQINSEAVLALAGFLALGVFAVTQAVKVVGIAQDAVAAGRVALGVAGFLGTLTIVGYLFPAFLPMGLIVYSTLIAISAAANGYQYLVKPLASRLFPGIAVSSVDLNEEE